MREKASLPLACILLLLLSGCSGLSDLKNSQFHTTKSMSPREKAYLACIEGQSIENSGICLRESGYALKHRLPQGIKVDEWGCPVDEDGDGVADHIDICPETENCVKVDKQGCPKDSDNDGVVNSYDLCPGTGNNIIVNEVGCPIDSDGDGVPDELDLCPTTPVGAKVDETGCWALSNILFALDKAVIRPQYYYLLDEVAEVIRINDGIEVNIDGHTCILGTEKYNQDLSERRAAAVRDYLVEKGVSPDTVRITGFNFRYPHAANTSETGRRMNRRAEIITLK